VSIRARDAQIEWFCHKYFLTRSRVVAEGNSGLLQRQNSLNLAKKAVA
jgi:hypothetical protein